MKIKRAQPRPGYLSTKVLVVLFIAVVSLFASLNLSPDSSSNSGLPIYHANELSGREVEITTVRTYTNDEGADIVEHDFSSLVDPAEQDGAEELEAERSKQSSQYSNDEADVEDKDYEGNGLGELAEKVEAAQKMQNAEIEKKSSAVGLNAGTTAIPPNSVDKYHVLVTVGDGLYVEWQARVCYYWYKKVKATTPGNAMGGFTRLLHSGVADKLMDEIPTVVVDPLPAEMEELMNGYVVLNRPYGILQWVREYLKTIPEKYVLMSEPDHLFVKAPPLWATPTTAAAFPFFYMTPQKQEDAEIIAKFNKKNAPISKFAPVGNSPVMISAEQMAPVVEIWANLSIAVKQDEQADKAWGWIQEMYAWSIASTQVEPIVEYELHPELMIQPPWDADLKSSENGKPIYIIHYTYGNDFDLDGRMIPDKIGPWHFDKRDFMEKYPPLKIPMPPKGCTNIAVKKIISMINEASANIPGWGDLAYTSMKQVPHYFEEREKEDNENDEGGEEEQNQNEEEATEER